MERSKAGANEKRSLDGLSVIRAYRPLGVAKLKIFEHFIVIIVPSAKRRN